MSLPRYPFMRSDRAGQGTMGDEVEAGAECVRDHLQRPDHPDRELTNAKVRSAVFQTVPPPSPRFRAEGIVAAIALHKVG